MRVLQAKLCVEGLKLSYEYFNKHNIPHKKVGKLIVAQTPEQVSRIDDLYDRGLKNNVPELEIIEKECIPDYEAKCKVRKIKISMNSMIFGRKITSLNDWIRITTD